MARQEATCWHCGAEWVDEPAAPNGSAATSGADSAAQPRQATRVVAPATDETEIAVPALAGSGVAAD